METIEMDFVQLIRNKMEVSTPLEKQVLADTLYSIIYPIIKIEDKDGPKRIDFYPRDGIVKLEGKSGRVYKVQRDVSGARYLELLAFEKEFQYNRTLTELQQDHTTLKNHLRKPDLVDAILLVDRLERALQNIGQRRSHVFMMLALFCNYDGEDVGVVNLDKVDEKVADFDHYATSDLFGCVAIMFPTYLEPSNNLSQTIMEKAAAINDLV